MNAFKQKHKFSPTFKIGALLILIFGGLGIAFGVGLFIFGMAWLFMGVFQTPKIDSNVTWGTVMMVLGFYVSMMSLFALFLASNAMHKKKANGVVLMAIISIAGVIPMIGGIIILFSPIDEPVKPKPVDDDIQTFDHKGPNNHNKSDSSINQDPKPHADETKTMQTQTIREVEILD